MEEQTSYSGEVNLLFSEKHTLMLHPHNILNEFIMGSQREKIMRLEGIFMGSIMGDEGSEQSGAWHKKTCKKLWVRIMPGTKKLWVLKFLFHF